MIKRYAVADWHFNHNNIIKLCERPFSSVEEMNETIVENHNKIVKPSDIIFVLGDVGMGKDVMSWVEKLNGELHLIKGNHDDNKIVKNKIWKSVMQYRELKYNGHKWILFHYPIYSWNGKWRNSIHLHGHTHNKLDSLHDSPVINMCNVGVDLNRFEPVDLDRITPEDIRKHYDET